MKNPLGETQINQITEEIFGMYERFGDEDYIGEACFAIGTYVAGLLNWPWRKGLTMK